MGITDKSRQQAKQQQNSPKPEVEVETASQPNKAEIKRQIDILRTQAETVDCKVAYGHLMAKIRELSNQL